MEWQEGEGRGKKGQEGGEAKRREVRGERYRPPYKNPGYGRDIFCLYIMVM